MKLCAIVFAVLVACALSYAVKIEEQGPLLNALTPSEVQQESNTALVRPKRGLILGMLKYRS